jgi:hypothetical protein
MLLYSGSSGLTPVRVRVPPSAPENVRGFLQIDEKASLFSSMNRHYDKDCWIYVEDFIRGGDGRRILPYLH